MAQEGSLVSTWCPIMSGGVGEELNEQSSLSPKSQGLSRLEAHEGACELGPNGRRRGSSRTRVSTEPGGGLGPGPGAGRLPGRERGCLRPAQGSR